MDMKQFLAAMEHIETDVAQVIGAIKATMYKQQRTSETSKQMSAVLTGEEVRKYKGKTIKRRADGRWWTRYTGKDKKQHSVYGKTLNECLQKLKAALKENLLEEKPKPLLFEEWLAQWLQLYKKPKMKESTFYQTTTYAKRLTPFYKQPLNQITTLQIQTFLLNVEKPKARQHFLDVLRDCLNKAVKNDLIPKNPCDNVDLPKHKSKQSKALTQEEENRFVEECKKDKFGLQFLLCLYQGLRIGETQLLTLADFDFEKKTLRIDKNLNDLNHVDTPKSETSIRTLPLFQRTIDALQTMPFQIVRGDKYIYKHFKDICARANISGCTVHSLRHTFATRCAEVGISPNTTKQWMGHSTIQLTLDIYTHVNKDFEQKEKAKFDTYFDTTKR